MGGMSRFAFPLIAPPHIAGDGFALGLGEGCEERSHHFAGHRRSVNVLFLEVDADTERFQLSDGFQAFLRLALTSEEALTIKYPYDVAGYFSESFGQLF